MGAIKSRLRELGFRVADESDNKPQMAAERR